MLTEISYHKTLLKLDLYSFKKESIHLIRVAYLIANLQFRHGRVYFISYNIS